MSKRHRRVCPSATKTAFPDRIAAEVALINIRAAYDRNPVGPGAPVRSYQCSCGKWHLTSQARPYADPS